ncbi:UrcA family protein [Sphingomonas sp. MMS24-J13]|uniref:UrcA family protein n=1 Tax=Sphingomonas sp. MMS24-J13 TaxID=3238686 RepID=UPI00384EE471
MARLSPLALAAAMIATSLSVLAPAGAASTYDPDVRIVHYGDLDLSTEAGRAVLDHRVRSAINRICHNGSVVDLEALRLCQENAMAATRPAVQLAIRNSENLLATADSAFRTVLR